MSESFLVSLQEKLSALNRQVFMMLDAWLTARKLTFPYNTRLYRQREECSLGQHFIRGEKGATCRKEGLLLLDSSESSTKIRLNQHMANPSGTKAGLISPKIRDKLGSEEGRCGLCSPVSTKVWDISRERLS